MSQSGIADLKLRYNNIPREEICIANLIYQFENNLYIFLNRDGLLEL